MDLDAKAWKIPRRRSARRTGLVEALAEEAAVVARRLERLKRLEEAGIVKGYRAR
jgi:DNA-binding Lrp family transcriptional regulator